MRQTENDGMGVMDSKNALETLRSKFEELSKAEQRPAQYVLSYPGKALDMNVGELAEASGCSESTVVRMCQHAGFKGYYQLRLMIARELGEGDTHTSPDGNALERATNASTLSISLLRSERNVEAVSKAALMLKQANKVLVCAAGNTIPIAMDMAFRLNRINIAAFTSTVFEHNINYISNAGSDDVLVAISKSGASTFVYDEVRFAKKRGMKLIAITADSDSRLAHAADITLVSSRAGDTLMYEQKGLQSHVSDLCLIDAIMYSLNDIASEFDSWSGEEAEFELSGWRE